MWSIIDIACQVTTPNNLPADLTTFVGREPQLAELRRLLRRSRLITLTGPGGAGKTRLALRLVSGVLDRFPGGVWFVELGPLSDPAVLDRAVAAACGIREAKQDPIVDSLVERLSGLRALLIFDGAEHLIDACRSLGERLLRRSRSLTLLVTSREPLGISGELIWRTPSLTVPGAAPTDLVGLLQSEAVRLFLNRAQLANPNFSLERDAHLDLAEICTRLDGLPLAIELAASLTGAMTVSEIRTQFRHRYRLLTAGNRNAVPRARTLKHAIDWSYDLLSEDERELFARLAVFAGGFDLEATQAVASDQGDDVVATLMRLVDKSLVVAESRPSSRTRYRMLDTIREYAADRLQAAASVAVRRSHAAHLLDFAQKAARELRGGDQAYWLDRIEEETPNLRLALAWYESNGPDSLMALTGYLSRYWYVRGKFTDGLEWLDKAVDAEPEDPAARLPALQNRARLRRHRGDYEGARRDAEECVALARQVGSDLHLMGGLVTLGNLSASLALWKDAGRFFSEALQFQERINDPALIAGGLNNLALIESAQGHHDQAKLRIEQALAVVEQVGDRILRASIRESAGRIERRRGDRAAARRHYLHALEMSTEFEDVLNIADVLDGLSLLALGNRDPNRALTLAAASATQRSASESEPPHWDQEEVADGTARARSMQGPAAAAAAWRRGTAMSLRDAVAYATGAIASHRTNSGPALTAREMQVASLIAEGLTNAEIAGRLKFAERTADSHVEHIRNKLGLHSRSQIAVWAHDRR